MSEHLLNISVYDGDRSGCKQCTSLSKSLVGYKIPRSRLAAMANINDLGRNGVYFLFGESIQNGRFVYIGKVGNRKGNTGLKSRLAEHLRDDDYWFETVILTSCNGSISATEASYLEFRFYSIAKDAKRYELRNKSTPPSVEVNDSLKIELEKIVKDGILYLSALGCDVFVPLRDPVNDLPIDVFVGKTKRCNAMLVQTETGFALLKGSIISKAEAKTCPPSVKALRSRLKKAIGRDGKLKRDVSFASPSAAYCFASGSTGSGLTFFKNNRGETVADLE